MRFYYWLVCWVGLLSFASLNGNEITIFEGPYRISVGPTVYHLQRTKEGGSNQQGVLGGVQACVERWRPKGVYWGLEGTYATGRLHGHTASGRTIDSRLTEKEVEGRLGYNIAANFNRFQLVPFICGGKYECENKFVAPSPMTTTFNDHFDFIGYGFYLVCNLVDRFYYGFTFKAHYATNGWDELTHDPGVEDSKSRIKSEWQYDVEFPFQYGSTHQGWAMQLIPFYRFRHFGGMESYPFDFIETKFTIYGARLMVMKSF